jgi:hypothetical protein
MNLSFVFRAEFSSSLFIVVKFTMNATTAGLVLEARLFRLWF